MAKMTATESAQQVIDAAVQLFGGLGVTRGQVVERLYREIRALRIYEGATEVQKLIVARELLRNRRERRATGVAEPSARAGACPGWKGTNATGAVMSYTAHVDTFARDNLPPPRSVAGIHLRAAGAAVSGAPE